MMTKRGASALPVTVTLLALIGSAFWWMARSPGAAIRPGMQTEPALSFKITFGLKQKLHGRVWTGVLRNPAQIRSVRGWHLDASDSITLPDRWNLSLRTVAGETPSKAVILDVLSPPQQPVVIYTREGDISFTPARVPYGVIHYIPESNGDISVERVPAPQMVSSPEFEDDDPALLRTRGGEYWMAWVAYKTISRSGDYIDGGDQIFVARSRDARGWPGNPESRPLTQPGDHFRVALAEDGRGLIWCVYSKQRQIESGNFDLYARVFDGTDWSAEQQLTTDPRPDVFHRLASDRDGNLYLVWMGFRLSSGGPAQSEVLMRVRSRDRWSDEINVSSSPEDDWEPALSVDNAGRAWIAWDSYRGAAAAGGYDILLRHYADGSMGPVRTVSATPFAEMRADVAVDGSGRVWIAWEEGGVNWGKDTGYQNPKHRIHLRPGGSAIYGPANSPTALYRRPRVAVLDGEQLKQPVAEFHKSYPGSLQGNLFQNPRLGADASGRIWVFLRHQLAARGRNTGHLFDFYATTLRGQGPVRAG